MPLSEPVRPYILVDYRNRQNPGEAPISAKLLSHDATLPAVSDRSRQSVKTVLWDCAFFVGAEEPCSHVLEIG